jgi:hypothetical protein
MDLPYNISDFAFPSRWDSDSGPRVVERAGRPEINEHAIKLTATKIPILIRREVLPTHVLGR